MPNETIKTGSRTITEMMAGAGEPWALGALRGGLAGDVAGAFPSSTWQMFGTRIMDLLKQYQTLGTKPFQEAGLELEEERLRRLGAEAEPGAPPSYQRGVREAEAGALEPSISGLAARQQTFTEQIRGLGTAIEQARGIGEWMMSLEQQRQVDAKELIFGLPSVVKQMSPEEQKKLEEMSGLPKGIIGMMPEAVEPTKTQVVEVEGRKKLINSITGETIRDLGATTTGVEVGGLAGLDKKSLEMARKTQYVLGEMDEILKLWMNIPSKYRGKWQGRWTTWIRKAETVPEIREYETAKNLVGMALTRLYEVGVITDADRRFYMEQMPNIKQSDASAKVAKDTVKSQLRAKVSALLGMPYEQIEPLLKGEAVGTLPSTPTGFREDEWEWVE